MKTNFGKIKSFVNSLDLNSVEKKGQSLLLASDETYGTGVNTGCSNYGGCAGSDNRSGCYNYADCN